MLFSLTQRGLDALCGSTRLGAYSKGCERIDRDIGHLAQPQPCKKGVKMSLFRVDLNEVFTPRRAKVNRKMYETRPELEKALRNALEGSVHPMLFGESGNGKSWLYKTVFEDVRVPYVVVNCASIAGIKSLSGALLSAVVKPGTSVSVSFSEEKSAGVKAVVAEGGLKHTENYEVAKPEPILRAFSMLSKEHGQKRSVIVLDNLEAIFDLPELVSEIANAIILLDDERYAEHNIRFLLVGTPSCVLRFFSRSPNLHSVSNRVRELPKVGSLGEESTNALVTRGFQEFLKVKISDLELKKLCRYVYFVTMGVAQRVHELCQEIALQLRDNGWRYEERLLENAEREWISMGLRDSYVTIESNMNSRRSRVARRDQVIYAIGQVEGHQFDSSEIESLVKINFPATVPKSGVLGTGAILSELARARGPEDKPLLDKDPKTNQYTILDPRHIMCIRIIIHKDKNGRLVRKKFRI